MTEEIPQETIEAMERRVRKGLGPEEGFVDVFKEGLVLEAFTTSDAGRILIRDCLQRAARVIREMTSDASVLTPERAFRDVLALTSHLSILRRIAATICAGRTAADHIVALEQEAEAHAGPQPRYETGAKVV